MDQNLDGLGRVRKAQCPAGHPYNEANTGWKVNWKGYQCRECRECGKLRMRRKRENPERKKLDAEKARRWRARNLELSRKRARDAYRKRDQWIQSFKGKCKYCPESRFPCLDFHHREADEKDATIAQVRHWSHERLQAEIEKCDIVCANCHRWLHWKEKQKQLKEGVNT